LILLCGVVPTIVVAVLSLYRPSMFSSVESGIYDRLVRAIPTSPPRDRIVILDDDELSLARIGQWPWRRDVIGKLVERLREWGAAVVALDIVFAEPDRFESTGSTPDAALADSLRGGRVILGYAMTFDGTHHASRTCVRHPIGLAIVQPAEVQNNEPFFHATGAVCNLESLSDAAGTSGFLNAAPDTDGILRRVPMIVEYDGNVYPSLSLAAVTMATSGRASAIRVANVNSAELSVNAPPAVATGRLHSMAKATCCSAIAARNVRFSTTPRATCLLATPIRRPSRTRSSSLVPPRSARAKWSRRRSIRCLPVSRFTQPPPTTCSRVISSHDLSIALRSRRNS
jgi:hypothetical protein